MDTYQGAIADLRLRDAPITHEFEDNWVGPTGTSLQASGDNQIQCLGQLETVGSGGGHSQTYQACPGGIWLSGKISDKFNAWAFGCQVCKHMPSPKIKPWWPSSNRLSVLCALTTTVDCRTATHAREKLPVKLQAAEQIQCFFAVSANLSSPSHQEHWGQQGQLQEGQEG